MLRPELSSDDRVNHSIPRGFIVLKKNGVYTKIIHIMNMSVFSAELPP